MIPTSALCSECGKDCGPYHPRNRETGEPVCSDCFQSLYFNKCQGEGCTSNIRKELEKHLCDECERKKSERESRERWGEKAITEIPELVDRVLSEIGCSPRERKADLALVPDSIKRVLPRESVKAFLDAKLIKTGWGIGGNTGGGKSMAQVAMLKKTLSVKIEKDAKTKGAGIIPMMVDSLLWVSWPDEVNWLRSHATSDETPERIERMSKVPLLFLDDLGRERIRGSYADDWAASQLDGIINYRYRHELATIWTTNLTEEALANIYGAAMLSRLTADNPLCWVDDLASMRLK